MKLLVFLFFFIPTHIFALYSWDRSSVDHLVQEGISALYNYDFTTSISVLDSAWSLDSTNPVIPFILVSTKWLKAQSEFGYDASYSELFRAEYLEHRRQNLPPLLPSWDSPHLLFDILNTHQIPLPLLSL